jgi:hypothetical protein
LRSFGSLPPHMERVAAGLDFVNPVVHPGICRTSGGISHVPEQPPCTFALLYDPGRIGRVRPLRQTNAVPASHHVEDSIDKFLSRLYHTASVLTVYASQGGSPHHHARLASGCRPGSTGWDSLTHWAAAKGFG